MSGILALEDLRLFRTWRLGGFIDMHTLVAPARPHRTRAEPLHALLRRTQAMGRAELLAAWETDGGRTVTPYTSDHQTPSSRSPTRGSATSQSGDNA